MIINADSQQVYRDLPILTARPSPEEETELPHKLYGLAGADEQFSAGKWLRFAKMEIDWAISQGTTPIVVGGTGLYIKALMEGIADMPAIDPKVRAQSMNDYEAMGKDAFAARLREIDPQFFERLKVTDRQRLTRAYEVWLGTGKTLSWWQQQTVTPPYSPEQFQLQIVDVPRDELYRRCDARFHAMIEQGAVEEVREILTTRPAGSYDALEKIIGFRELASFIRGELHLEEAIAKAQQMTRNYAKRQTTWFTNQFK